MGIGFRNIQKDKNKAIVFGSAVVWISGRHFQFTACCLAYYNLNAGRLTPDFRH